MREDSRFEEEESSLRGYNSISGDVVVIAFGVILLYGSTFSSTCIF